MSWDDYRYFLAIARHGSLTAAGRSLGVSQPTVSRRLELMESTLKVRLFDRTRQGYQLTATGMELYETVVQVDERLGEVDRRIFGQDLEPTGALQVTCTEILLNGYLSPCLWQFLARHRGIGLSVISTDAQLSLGRREADVAIRFTRRPTGTLVGRRLAAVAFGLYAARGEAGERFTPQDRESWDWIGVHDDAHARILFSTAHPGGRFKHRVDSVATMQSMVRAGLGVSMLPCYIADRDAGLRRLAPAPAFDAGLELWILHHPDIRNVHRVRLFVDFIAEAIGADRDLFEGRRPL